MTKTFPRVLVVAHNPFNETRNNGITLSNLFRGWPRERLAQLYFPFATPIAPDFTVCERFWAVTPGAVLKGLAGIPIDGEVRREGGATAAPRGFALPLLGPAAQALARSQLAIDGAEPLRDLLLSLPSVLSRETRAWVRAFRPDLVYSILGSVPAMRLTLELAEMLGVPVVPHVTDDWPATLYTRTRAHRLLRPRAERAFGEVMDRAAVRLVISEAMAREYTRRYGHAFVPFGSVADGTRFDPAPPPATGAPVRFAYIGGLHLGRWRSLRRIADALDTLAAEGIDTRFDIYTMPDHIGTYARPLEGTRAVVQGWVPNHEVPALMARTDVLVHAESFDPATVPYIRYSISTKLGEYLLSGRPVLAHGPGEAASILHIRDTGSGIAVGEEDPAALLDAVRTLARDRERRLALGRQARLAGEEHHDTARQFERFRSVLQQAG